MLSRCVTIQVLLGVFKVCELSFVSPCMWIFRSFSIYLVLSSALPDATKDSYGLQRRSNPGLPDLKAIRHF